MGAMFFGQYLLSKGVIDREAFIDAIETQRKANLSLTQLAVRRGYLEPRQEESILAKYRMTDADLEDLCLESGYVSREQLDELLAIQHSDWVRIGAALVAGGYLTRDEVDHHLAEFGELQMAADQQLAADFQACRDPETVRTLVELAVFHLARFTNQPIKLRALSENGGRLTAGRRRFGLRLVGDRDLQIVLDLPQKVAKEVAEGFLGFQMEGDSEAAIDAVCECVNIIGGNACTRLEAVGVNLRPEPPFSTESDEPAGTGETAVCAEVLAGEAEVDVRVFL